MVREHVLVGLPHPRGAVPEATAVRGTVLSSSMNVIRELGLEEPYFRALPPELHDPIRGLVAHDWVPMPVAVAHYRALEQLGLGKELAREVGRRTAQRIQVSYMKTVTASLRVAGAVDPATALARFQSFLDRLVRGGSCHVVRTGPKDVRVEAHGVPIAQFAYVREAWAGMFEETLALVARSVYVVEIPKLRTPTTVAWQISWA